MRHFSVGVRNCKGGRNVGLGGGGVEIKKNVKSTLLKHSKMHVKNRILDVGGGLPQTMLEKERIKWLKLTFTFRERRFMKSVPNNPVYTQCNLPSQ